MFREMIVLSAYKRNDGTVGKSFAVFKGAHVKMGMFNVSAKLYLSWRDADSFSGLSWHHTDIGSSDMDGLGSKGDVGMWPGRGR